MFIESMWNALYSQYMCVNKLYRKLSNENKPKWLILVYLFFLFFLLWLIYYVAVQESNFVPKLEIDVPAPITDYNYDVDLQSVDVLPTQAPRIQETI